MTFFAPQPERRYTINHVATLPLQDTPLFFWRGNISHIINIFLYVYTYIHSIYIYTYIYICSYLYSYLYLNMEYTSVSYGLCLPLTITGSKWWSSQDLWWSAQRYFFVELSDPNGGFFYPSPTIPLIPLGTTASGLSRLNPDLVPDDQNNGSRAILGCGTAADRHEHPKSELGSF